MASLPDSPHATTVTAAPTPIGITPSADVAGSVSAALGTVLVIEDDPGVRHLARRTLEQVGYIVLEAEDGEAGLRIVEEHPGEVDLVLTDIEMPKLDGITVAKVLAAMRPRIGVVCMSGRLPESTFQERIGLPLPPFLVKPFSSEDLARTTSETLARFRDRRSWDKARETVTRHVAERQLAPAVDLITAARRMRSRSEGSSQDRARGRQSGDSATGGVNS